jgi:hypothetical protein
MNQASRRAVSILAIVSLSIPGALWASTREPEPIAYVIRMPTPATP